jgi:hypothetical protein
MLTQKFDTINSQCNKETALIYPLFKPLLERLIPVEHGGLPIAGAMIYHLGYGMEVHGESIKKAHQRPSNSKSSRDHSRELFLYA